MALRLLAAIVMVVALAVTACASSNDEGSADVDTAAVVESYVEAYNSGNFDELMSHFTDDSIIVGHPTDFDPEAADIGAIRRLHKEDLSFGEQYTISSIDVSGDTVTWDSIWGEDGCVQGHTTVVADGKIISWTWGEFVECSELG
jgi:hypothetical protein